jgi:hypothetical protein
MRLDPSAGQMNQQRAHQHLPHGDCVARARGTGPQKRQRDRKAADGAAEEDGGPDVHVDLARRAGPSARRDPVRCGNPQQPLHRHQDGEHAVGLDEQIAAEAGEDLVAPLARARGDVRVRAHGRSSCRKQPNTGI